MEVFVTARDFTPSTEQKPCFYGRTQLLVTGCREQMKLLQRLATQMHHFALFRQYIDIN